MLQKWEIVGREELYVAYSDSKFRFAVYPRHRMWPPVMLATADSVIE